MEFPGDIKQIMGWLPTPDPDRANYPQHPDKFAIICYLQKHSWPSSKHISLQLFMGTLNQLRHHTYLFKVGYFDATTSCANDVFLKYGLFES